MDLSFFRRAELSFGNRTAARLDYGVLRASLRAQQAASPAARWEAQCRGALPGKTQQDLIEVLLGGAGWREAAVARGGCFHPAAGAKAMGRKLK